ncbi:nucleotidyltransferase family protein [Paenibacillus aestuarii]|uniref:Nucleotidyltransferase family protein n=1 Tax=Paenibacillus aestuarii TaxID=516965 RepID=A0ABW0K3R7_9BACL|nr:hypothetical protein [Paenibacillus aestuarii]
MSLLEPMLPAINKLSAELRSVDAKWLIGGSCGLVMHEIDTLRSPRDLDLYVDGGDIPAIHTALAQFAVDEPAYSETPIYASTLSHYEILGATIELVGDFRVQALDSVYTIEATYLWEHHGIELPLEGLAHHVKMMPLAHELIFNVLRERPDRYEAIAQAMRRSPERHMPALHDLLKRNRMGSEFCSRLERLFQN